MTTTDLAPAKKVAILKHLAAGKSLDIVATIVHLKRDQVLDIASHHGYPDVDKLAWAVDVLEKKLADTDVLPDRTGEKRPDERPFRLTSPTTTRPAPTPQPTAPSRPDGIQALIATAKGHDSKRIQNAADKVLDGLDRLRTLMREDEEKHAARRAAAAEKAEARAEVERLQQQLAEARAKLRGNTGPAVDGKTSTVGPSAADVRAWAAKNDVACPAVGRVPSAVREAYDDAHRQEAS